MRFAVHGPGCPVASPRSHGVPRRDVPGSVHVSIAGETAGSADEARLTLARLPVHMPARTTALRSVRRVDLLDPSACLVFQAMYQQTPSGSQDFSVQSGLSANVVARLVASALRRTGHVADIQVLDANHIKPAGQSGAQFLNPVFSLVCLTDLQPPNRLPHAPTTVRPTPGAGEFTLQSHETSALWHGQTGNVHQFAVGKGSAGHHASVDAHSLAVAGGRKRIRDSGERDMPLTCSIQPNPVGLHARRYRARPAEPYPANLRNPNLADLARHTAYIPLFATANNPEPFIPSGLPPRRTPGRVFRVEEGRHRLLEITQSLLLHRLRSCGQPRVLRTGSGQLAALLQVARSAGAPTVPLRVLFNRQIPHEPSMRAMISQHCLLGWRRKQAVSGHTNTLATTTDIFRTAGGWRSRPWPKYRNRLMSPPRLSGAVLSGQSSARRRQSSARMADQ